MESADVVVVGGGTIGGWCAYFLRDSGLKVTLLESETLGQGASSRAAGMVRAQGGTPAAVRLGRWSQEFYRQQRELLGIDSGFVETGYFMPCFSEAEVSEAKARIAMQQELGLASTWIEAAEFDKANPAMAPGLTLGSTYYSGDGWIDPPRNVLAYTTALFMTGVTVRERTSFTGLRTAASGQIIGVSTSDGDIDCEQVVLTGGPSLAAVGAAAGSKLWSGGVRHQVVVTEPHPELAAARLPMVFDVRSGIYWRPEEGGMLWGMSNPNELPGEARRFDDDYFAMMRARIAQLVPVTAQLGLRRMWAATIDYTPDHLPLLGPLLRDGTPVPGAWVAAAGGHGMMWGPAVSRAAADLVIHGTTDVVDAGELGVSRFDAMGRSSLSADPIALPFPEFA